MRGRICGAVLYIRKIGGKKMKKISSEEMMFLLQQCANANTTDELIAGISTLDSMLIQIQQENGRSTTCDTLLQAIRQMAGDQRNDMEREIRVKQPTRKWLPLLYPVFHEVFCDTQIAWAPFDAFVEFKKR